MRKDDITRREFLGEFLAATAAFAVGAASLQSAALAAPSAGKAKDASPAKPARLPQRVLGRTGLNVSILGLGGAWFLQNTEDTDVVEQILNTAIDGGINFFDTAHNYKRSEENFGLVMGTPRRKEVYLATKVEDRTYDGAMQQFETSLKALRTDYVDLLQVHYVNPKDDIAAFGKPDGVITALRKLRDQKVARFIGVTGHPEFTQVKEVLEMYDDFDTFLGFINPQFSTRPAYDDQLPIARRKNMGIIAMKAFGGGDPPVLLGDKPGKASVPELLRYAMSQQIATCIPAVSSVAQLQQNLEIARTFTPMTSEEREALIARINFVPKPVKKAEVPPQYTLA